MYQVKKGEEYELFSENVINHFYNEIQNQIIELLNKTKKPKPAILGGFCINDVPMKNGQKTNVWIEYNAHILKGGLVDAGVHECILYDEIPDIVLDKYNDIKTIIYNESK